VTKAGHLLRRGETAVNVLLAQELGDQSMARFSVIRRNLLAAMTLVCMGRSCDFGLSLPRQQG
jgi:hypothetical protein